MIRSGMAMAALALLAGCGGETRKPAEAEKPATLVAGDYAVVSEVTMLAATDRSTPATPLKLGDKKTVRACVAADGTPDPAMFVEPGDTCTATNSFARAGRLSYQYRCSRPGKGEIFPNADGNYTADGYKAVVVVASSFSSAGNYRLTRMLTAKRVGPCPAQR